MSDRGRSGSPSRWVMSSALPSCRSKVPCHTDLEKQFADFLDAAGDVVRYFKNERFDFSVTYYENN